MDFTTGAFGAVAAGVFAVFGWVLKRSVAQMDQKLRDHSDALQEQIAALAAYKLHVAEHYVTQSELTKAIESLDKTMQRLLDAVAAGAKETREGFAEIHRRIDTKADK
ncbi:MAG: hypothetical protein JSV72_07280 [Ralstonia sp.]|jgi:hypothetical protein|nr:MAG: hypothetical protein JSV72_07280 [Ralstonia sp.]